jgi:hypothetical protein
MRYAQSPPAIRPLAYPPAGNHTAEIGLHALPHAGMALVTPRGKAVERYTSTKNYILEVVASPWASPASSSLGRHRDQKVWKCAAAPAQRQFGVPVGDVFFADMLLPMHKLRWPTIPTRSIVAPYAARGLFGRDGGRTMRRRGRPGAVLPPPRLSSWSRCIVRQPPHVE